MSVGIVARTARWLVFMVLLAAAWYLWVVVGWRPPDRINPFAPLDIAEEPGVFIRYKLRRLTDDPRLCLSTLSNAGFRYVPVPDSRPAPGCGLENAVRISRSAVAVGEPFTLSCPAAVSLALWERHVLQGAARQHLQQAVTRIDHLGSYACRNVNGREAGPRSRHATADAIDIAGFTLENGQRVRVLGDWKSAGGRDVAKARFLHAVRDGSCRFFDGVLSPDYNAAHADHLHLERHGYTMCR